EEQYGHDACRGAAPGLAPTPPTAGSPRAGPLGGSALYSPWAGSLGGGAGGSHRACTGGGTFYPGSAPGGWTPVARGGGGRHRRSVRALIAANPPCAGARRTPPLHVVCP